MERKQVMLYVVCVAIIFTILHFVTGNTQVLYISNWMQIGILLAYVIAKYAEGE